MASNTTSREETNKQVVRDLHRKVFTEKNFDVVEDLVAEDYVEHNPAIPGGKMHGRENVVRFWRGMFEAFPDLSITEEDVLCEGDTVVTRHIGHGTHESEFMEVEATGNEFEIEGIDIFHLEDGKITESWINLDMVTMMQQLGVMSEEQEEKGERG